MSFLAGEPAEKDLPAGGAAPQWDAAEGWVGAEMQVLKQECGPSQRGRCLRQSADRMQILWSHRRVAKQTVASGREIEWEDLRIYF